MYQQVLLVGNLGRDPELRYTPTGTAVCDFSLAVNTRWTGADGERQTKTTWFRVTAWRALAEHCAQYLSKGRQVMVVGRVAEPSAWIGKDGEARAQNEVTARDVRFLGSHKNGGAAPPPRDEEEIPF